jgi:hypothetical protein
VYWTKFEPVTSRIQFKNSIAFTNLLVNNCTGCCCKWVSTRVWSSLNILVFVVHAHHIHRSAGVSRYFSRLWHFLKVVWVTFQTRSSYSGLPRFCTSSIATCSRSTQSSVNWICFLSQGKGLLCLRCGHSSLYVIFVEWSLAFWRGLGASCCKKMGGNGGILDRSVAMRAQTLRCDPPSLRTQSARKNPYCIKDQSADIFKKTLQPYLVLSTKI